MSEPTLRIFFDASALIKRYSPEPGSDVIDGLFNLIPTGRMACSTLGMLEVISILLRQYNGNRLLRPAFEQLSLQQKGGRLILCAADKRLARAAIAEGLTVFNPETDSIPRLHQLLGLPGSNSTQE